MTLIRQTKSRRRSAFTLPELLLAITIASAIGFAVLLILGGIAAATTGQADNRRANVRRQVAIARIGTLTRTSIMTLDHTANSLVLWGSDANLNGIPELSEIRLIWWDNAGDVIINYEAPAGLAPGDDVSFALTDDFSTITSALAGTVVFPGSTVIDQVSAWDVVLDELVPQSARQMRIEMTIENDHGPEPAVIIAALRQLTSAA